MESKGYQPMSRAWGVVKFLLGVLLALLVFSTAVTDFRQIDAVHHWTSSRSGYIIGTVVGLGIMFSFAYSLMRSGLNTISRANALRDEPVERGNLQS